MRIFVTLIIMFSGFFKSQQIAEKLSTATKNLLNSSAMYSGNLSFYVAEENGTFVYEYQGNRGLSCASTQKIFTAACALETLGKDFRFTTTSSFSGNLSNGILDGNLFVTSNGDPTLGSWRYDDYKPENFLRKIIASLQSKNVKKITGNIVIDDSYFDFQKIPGGWPWNDVGNYYGAGVWSVNWRENQFDILMNGSQIKNFNINLSEVKFVNELKTAGTSDRSLIYTAPHSNVAHINGSLPAKNMTISGSTPNPPYQLGLEIAEEFKKNNIDFKGKIITTSQQLINGETVTKAPKNNVLLEYKSPTLDKIVYWFLRKSVNLYGETLIKTIAKEKTGNPSFESGIDYLKNFWKSKGIQSSMINFADGSGLSPQNYVSARAEVQALLYAKKQTWFNEFFEGFPVQGNGMKMKSGTIKDSKSFAGYHTSASGKKYVFAIIMNNYQQNDLSDALYKVLNVLK